MNGQQNIVLVSSKDLSAFGTAFVFLRDGSYCYLLTCSHVLRDIGGLDKLLVRGYDGQVEVLAEDEDFDFAILRCSASIAQPGISLGINRDQVRGRFIVSGFHLFGRQILGENIDVELDKAIKVQSRVHGEMSAWYIKTCGQTPLQRGFSGAPLIDLDAGQVVGMVVQREGEGWKGLAVSAEVVTVVWPERPSTLLEPPDHRAKRELLARMLSSDLVSSGANLRPEEEEVTGKLLAGSIGLKEAASIVSGIIDRAVKAAEHEALVNSEVFAGHRREQDAISASIAEIDHCRLEALSGVRSACEQACAPISDEIEVFYTDVAKSSKYWLDRFFAQASPFYKRLWRVRRRMPLRLARNLRSLLSEKMLIRVRDWEAERLRGLTKTVAGDLNLRASGLLTAFLDRCQSIMDRFDIKSQSWHATYPILGVYMSAAALEEVARRPWLLLFGDASSVTVLNSLALMSGNADKAMRYGMYEEVAKYVISVGVGLQFKYAADVTVIGLHQLSVLIARIAADSVRALSGSAPSNEVEARIRTLEKEVERTKAKALGLRKIAGELQEIFPAI